MQIHLTDEELKVLMAALMGHVTVKIIDGSVPLEIFVVGDHYGEISTD
jgi:hypothetical protein